MNRSSGVASVVRSLVWTVVIVAAISHSCSSEERLRSDATVDALATVLVVDATEGVRPRPLPESVRTELRHGWQRERPVRPGSDRAAGLAAPASCQT